jgi:acetylornithine/succinyldiaminopimelate/putrescine aminotransferase
MDIFKRAQKFLGSTGNHRSIEIVKTNQDFLYDAKGQKYIDFSVGWCVGNLGWGNTQIRKAIKNYTGPEYVAPAFAFQPWVELAETLADITPGKLIKSFAVTGGTEAVEVALRAANIYTKRNKFISLENSYHGESIGAMSIAASSFKHYNPGLLFSSYKLTTPFNNKTLAQVEKYLKRGDVAALIMEPISMALNVHIPDPTLMKQIAALCKRFGALLIMDEVACGFGRTGKMFATQHYNIKPDIMCLAKGLTGGYGGLGTTIMTKEVAKVMENESLYYSTFGWHPISTVASLANLNYMQKNWKKIAANIEEMSDYFYERLSTMNFKKPAQFHIKGLAIGVSFSKGDYGKQIVDRARKKGLILASNNNHEFMMFPTLTIDRNTAKQGLDILEECL